MRPQRESMRLQNAVCLSSPSSHHEDRTHSTKSVQRLDDTHLTAFERRVGVRNPRRRPFSRSQGSSKFFCMALHTAHSICTVTTRKSKRRERKKDPGLSRLRSERLTSAYLPSRPASHPASPSVGPKSPKTDHLPLTSKRKPGPTCGVFSLVCAGCCVAVRP